MPFSILQAYELKGEPVQAEPLHNGLINKTWKIKSRDDLFILQRINDAVFKKPADIAFNIQSIATYLQQHSPGYLFVAPLTSNEGKQLVYEEGEGYYRLFPFVANSHSKNVVATSSEAYEAAAQFGRFTKLLAGFDAMQLKTTLPQFHDLSYRYRQFTRALQNGNLARIREAEALISFIHQYEDIVATYEFIKQSPDFKKRVTHHDTKISNVLFNEAGKGLCVIDLDTVMPGYFISDVGDMMRTYLSPVSEEETDFAKIEIRDDIYMAIVKGYDDAMGDELTELEKNYFFYSGKFMIYMQAMRFLTDYLLNDIYYGAKYPEHNFNRAMNQVVLLKRLMEKKAVLTKNDHMQL